MFKCERNSRNAFVARICEKRCSCTEYKKFYKRKVDDSIKRECLFHVRGYLLIAYYCSLKVGDGNHNHVMGDGLNGHKIIGSLNPNESRYLSNLTDSEVP